MKKNYNISHLISKSILKTISEDEKVILDDWLSIPENKELWKKIVDNNAIRQKITSYQNIDVEKAYHKIESQIHSKQKVRFLNVFKYAAIIIGIISSSYFLYQQVNTSEKSEIVNTKVLLKSNSNSITEINENDSLVIKDDEGKVIAVQKGNTIVYNKLSKSEKITYSTIIVPRGKTFQINLADNTTIHLNAETTLKFPLNFIDGINREVYLNGEAFFEVNHNKASPFIVNSENLDIKVLGTKFNVTAYPENNNIDVALVDGSVSLKSDLENTSTPIFLKPSFKGSYTKTNSSISTQKVNTKFYTSWVHGELLFRNKTFNEITKQLERKYNVIIKNKNISLGNEVFNASFNNQSIENILIYFNEAHEINYKIKTNLITIY